MLLSKNKENSKHGKKKKKYSPLIRKYLQQTGNNAKFAIIYTIILAGYIVIGAFVFYYLEDCQLLMNDDQVQVKYSNDSLDNVLNKYCVINDTEVIKEALYRVGNCSNGTYLQRRTPQRNKCKETNSERIEQWLLHTFSTVHALGYGEILQTNSNKLISILYSLFGLIISAATYIKLGSTLMNSFKLLVVLIELKLSKGYNKRRINYLYCKTFIFNVMFLGMVIVVASLTTRSMNGDRTELLDHLAFWWSTILTIGSRDFEIYQQASIVVFILFTFIGMTFLSATVWNVCQAWIRFRQHNRKGNGKGKSFITSSCCCCCFGGYKRDEGDEGVLFKDVATQKWGSLMSINNASNVELRSMDGSMRGNVFENSNRVDSQCTIKRLSEIERDPGHRGNEDDFSGSDLEADDELDVLSPIMVTAAVATRRTVNDLS